MAYWQFEDGVEFGDGGASRPHLSAKDSSGRGNDLPLVSPPRAADVLIHAKVGLCSPTARRLLTSRLWVVVVATLMPALDTQSCAYMRLYNTTPGCFQEGHPA